MKAIMDPKTPGCELVRKAQDGDREAFAVLLAHYRERLERAVRRGMGLHLGREAGLEDVLQETALRAVNSIKTFRYYNDESFPRWLVGIANHVVLELAAREERSRKLCLKPDLASGEVSPSRLVRREERFDRLVEALNALADDHRKVILLARIEGLRIQEIAQRMDRSENAVLLLLSRALKKLKESFGDTESLHLPWRSLKERGLNDA
jgi:RNA polymerase sigma-70 factor (ECF subfamily)